VDVLRAWFERCACIHVDARVVSIRILLVPRQQSKSRQQSEMDEMKDYLGNSLY
jgi:hypothetical protein